jgi:hypothetical protein
VTEKVGDGLNLDEGLSFTIEVEDTTEVEVISLCQFEIIGEG